MYEKSPLFVRPILRVASTLKLSRVNAIMGISFIIIRSTIMDTHLPSNFITENSLRRPIYSVRLNYSIWPQSLYSPDGGPPSPTVSSHSVQSPAQPTPAPRWPLKPGVLVHINRTHSLRSGLSVRANEANLRNELVDKHNDEPLRQRFLDETSLSSVGHNPARAVFRRGRKDQTAQRTASMTSLNEDGMLARANKIKAMFGVQLKEQATLPGISREKTGKSSRKGVELFTRDFARCHPTHLYLQLLACLEAVDLSHDFFEFDTLKPFKCVSYLIYF